MATEPEAQTLERPGVESRRRIRARRAAAIQSGYGSQLDEAEIIRQFVPVVKAAGAAPQGAHARDGPARRSDPGRLIAVLRLARHGGTAPSTDPRCSARSSTR
jgi:hypothetical protein